MRDTKRIKISPDKPNCKFVVKKMSRGSWRWINVGSHGIKRNKSSLSRTIIYCRSLSSCGQYYYIHFSNKKGMAILSVVCTQCIIQSKISAFPGPYSTLKCPLCRSLLLNSTKLCMQLLASRVQYILQPLQLRHPKPFALVLRHTGYWPKSNKGATISYLINNY